MTTHHWLEVEPGVGLNVLVDDFTDPWRNPETVVLVHSMGQSLEAWRGWVPHLARDFRVVRFDVRGFGDSTPMPATARWSMERLLADIEAVIDYGGGSAAHVIGSQSGGSAALALAARMPRRVRSVVAVSPMITGTPHVGTWMEQIEAEGVSAWARTTMAGRLGSAASPEQIDYWANVVQGRTPISTLRGYLRWVPSVDIHPELACITRPSLVMTTTGSGLRSLEGVKAWQETMRNSELLVIEGDAWHAAGAYPDVCARAAHAFMLKHAATAHAI